jgi:hypothetical protein
MIARNDAANPSYQYQGCPAAAQRADGWATSARDRCREGLRVSSEHVVHGLGGEARVGVSFQPIASARCLIAAPAAWPTAASSKMAMDRPLPVSGSRRWYTARTPGTSAVASMSQSRSSVGIGSHTATRAITVVLRSLLWSAGSLFHCADERAGREGLILLRIQFIAALDLLTVGSKHPSVGWDRIILQGHGSVTWVKPEKSRVS